MLKIGYYQGQRLAIENYEPAIHEGKVYCEDGHILIAKRGEVRMHHFSHRAGEGAACSASEGKTDWHLWWQSRLLPRSIELRLTRPVLINGVQQMITKIADSSNFIGQKKDILSIVEFQNSVMSKEEMAFREEFYSRRDLMSPWGLPDCESQLTWIFNLNECDLNIEHIYGDLVCLEWHKGTKYMLPAKARTFYDLGRRDLIQIFAIHKPETTNPKLIGRLIPIEIFDRFFFEGVLTATTDDERRLNTHPLGDYHPLPIQIDQSHLLVPLIEKLKEFYFKKLTASKLKKIEGELQALVRELKPK